MENRGPVHEYLLGITINHSIAGKVVFMMFDYLANVILECPEDLKNSCSFYPRNNQLFDVVKDSPRLPPEDAEQFHPHVERILLASKRERSNIQVCVAFLCTQVKSPMEQDYMKLRIVISYLKETVHLLLAIGTDNSGTLTWNNDVSFAIHQECKSPTGACLTLGHGSLC